MPRRCSCGREITAGRIILAEDENGVVLYCSSCAWVCWKCNKVTKHGEGRQWQVLDGRNTRLICLDCRNEYYDEDYFSCSNCGVLSHNDNMCYCDNCDTELCEDCYSDHYHDDDEDCDCDDCARERRNGKIYDGRYKPSEFNFLHTDREPKSPTSSLYLGVELEVDKTPSENFTDMIETLHELSEDEELFYMKYDGSLGSFGVEIVSHPCTIAYHRKKFPWEDITEICKKYHAKSHDANTCGLHIHADKRYLGKNEHVIDMSQYKAMSVVTDMFEEFSKFSRRNEFSYCNKNELGRWRREFSDLTTSAKTIWKSSRRYSVKKTQEWGERYRAVNILPKNTVELRLWRGSLDIKTIFASLEMTNSIIKASKDMSIATAEKLTWPRFVPMAMKYDYPQYLGEYIAKQGLSVEV